MSFPRYPAYKDSGLEWLGEVPEHWTLAPLKKLLDIQNGSDYKAVETEDGYPVIGSGGPFAFASQYHYDGESVLLGRKGTIDRPLYVRERFWAVDTMYWSKIRDGAHGRFAFYTSQCIPFQYYSTNTALPSMTKSLLGSHIIAVPCETEQGAIATFLDRETAKIDALIAEQQRLIELLQEKRQAVISHAVTKGLNPDAPMKDSGVEWLGEVPEHWEVMPLKRIVAMQSGNSITAETIESAGAYPVYGGNGLRGYTSSFTHSGEFVLIGRQGALCGNINYATGRFFASEHAVVATARKSVDVTWLGEMMRTMNLNQYSVSAAQPGLSVELIGNVRTIYAPLEEQRRLAGFLSDQSETLAGLSTEAFKAIDLLQERRSALISAAVTGRIDVRGLVPEVSE